MLIMPCSEPTCLGDLVKCLPDGLWYTTGRKKEVVVCPALPTYRTAGLLLVT